MRKLLIFITILLSFIAANSANALPVFPGAEGYGTNTTGGRETGSILCKVNSAADTNTGCCGTACSIAEPSPTVCRGTFRYCATVGATPRMIVFRTGGNIVLSGDLNMNDPHMSIFGQTAPGSGIVISSTGNNGVNNRNIQLGASDVLIQSMRFRVDDFDYSTNACVSPSENSLDVSTPTGGINNIVIDHCSLSWACNEILNLGWYKDNTNFTLSWSIISEGFHLDTGTDKYGFGMNTGDITGLTYYHNLSAHNGGRNFKMGGYETLDGSGKPITDMNSFTNGEAINNIIYNWSTNSLQIFENQNYIPTAEEPARDIKVDIINNYWKHGIDTEPFIGWSHEIIAAVDANELAQKADAFVFISGNYSDWHPTAFDVDSQWANLVTGDSGSVSKSRVRACTPPSNVSITQSATDAYNAVLNSAGAMSSLNPRDSVDTSVINDVRTGTGNQIYGRDAAFPTYTAGTAPTDSDLDGLPDTWENNDGCASTNPSLADTNTNGTLDWQEDCDGDGYWNIEEYATSLISTSAGDTTAPAAPSGLAVL